VPAVKGEKREVSSEDKGKSFQSRGGQKQIRKLTRHDDGFRPNGSTLRGELGKVDL